MDPRALAPNGVEADLLILLQRERAPAPGSAEAKGCGTWSWEAEAAPSVSWGIPRRSFACHGNQ